MEFRVQGLVSRVSLEGSGIRVQGSEFQGFIYTFLGFFTFQGFDFRVCSLEEVSCRLLTAEPRLEGSTIVFYTVVWQNSVT